MTLYTKSERGLCADAEAILLRVLKLIQFEAEFVYIEDDDQLYECYGERVPVVVVDGREVASARLMKQACLPPSLQLPNPARTVLSP